MLALDAFVLGGLIKPCDNKGGSSKSQPALSPSTQYALSPTPATTGFLFLSLPLTAKSAFGGKKPGKRLNDDPVRESGYLDAPFFSVLALQGPAWYLPE